MNVTTYTEILLYCNYVFKMQIFALKSLLDQIALEFGNLDTIYRNHRIKKSPNQKIIKDKITKIH